MGTWERSGAAILIRSVYDEFYESTLTLENTHVVNNEGHGISVDILDDFFTADELRIVDSDVSGNGGTGLRLFTDDEASAEILNSCFNNNARGMTIYGTFGESVTIQGSEIKDNTTGGGLTLVNYADVEINETTISGNHNTADGGGIRTDGFTPQSLSIRNSTISGNSTTGDGGGMWLDEYTQANIAPSTITNNTASGSGGGIAFNSTYDSSPDSRR